jgi:nucleoside phosphorylase
MIPMTQPDVETPDIAVATARIYSREDYTIGWICALPVEMAAAMALLDTIHPDLSVHPIDHNTYAFGKIGEHNIVVACLPAGVYGTTSAAVAAAQMMNSFESLRFGLLVGIGGGIPYEGADIRLGDVVVSSPSGRYGGVVQFDLGKLNGDGAFQTRGALNYPPNVLLWNLATLQAKHIVHENNISKTLSEMLERYPAMRDEQFVYQGEEHDMLYNSTYSHRSDKYSCHDCDRSHVVHRPARDTSPEIHYGIIGSANRVVKDAITRERLRNEFGIICVEMEAAGLMNNFPCLVIRGICDYADSHKNKRWQPYAAATAAAYAKELLAIIPSPQTIATVRAVQVVQQKHD